MADPANVFGEAPPEAPPVIPPVQSGDKVATLLASIKNEDGVQKYDTLDKALEALAHSQAYIPQVKTQLSEKEQEVERLKAELSQRETIDDVVKRLTQREPQEPDNRQVPSGMDEQTVAALVRRELESGLSAREQQAQAQANVARVQDALVRQFGTPEKAAELVRAKAEDLGTTPAALQEQAAKNPALILELFKAQGVQTPNPTTRGLNMSVTNPNREPLKRPEKSLMRGATTGKDATDFMKKIKAEIHAKHGITD